MEYSIFISAVQELDKDAEPAPERLLDWKKDALRIWGDFRLYAGIDLENGADALVGVPGDL